MADPIIANTYRAQVIFQGPSGLPEDRFVNSFAFVRSMTGGKNAEEMAAEISERLREFYLEANVGGGVVASYLAGDLKTGDMEIRVYDLGQPPHQRVPMIFTHDLSTTVMSSSLLPREVAVTASFYAEFNRPRRRGRIYLGPLNTTCQAAGGLTVHAQMQTAVAESMERLATAEGATDESDWGVLSGADMEIRPVTNGWVDDAFDTQRRRGQEATGRTTWSDPAVISS